MENKRMNAKSFAGSGNLSSIGSVALMVDNYNFRAFARSHSTLTSGGGVLMLKKTIGRDDNKG